MVVDCLACQRREFDSVKVFLLPKSHLAHGFAVEVRIGKGTQKHIRSAGEHNTARLQPVHPSLDKGLDHSLVDQKDPHWLGNDDVNLFWNGDVFQFSFQHCNNI
eukprot:Lithocolla_globosa_v1_NODE_5588_length_1215_cov_6.294828.p3 type:complete len:104 gc:universal NODE_5588_length_1215_cov_6.294828:483-794(+)